MSFGHMYLHIYLGHDESSRSMHRDDVVQVPANELPPIFSPITKKNNDQDEQATDEAVPSGSLKFKFH
jgi:hypothetical protein